MVRTHQKPITIDWFSYGESVAIDFNGEKTFKVACSHVKMEKVPN